MKAAEHSSTKTPWPRLSYMVACVSVLLLGHLSVYAQPNQCRRIGLQEGEVGSVSSATFTDGHVVLADPRTGQTHFIGRTGVQERRDVGRPPVSVRNAPDGYWVYHGGAKFQKYNPAFQPVDDEIDLSTPGESLAGGYDVLSIWTQVVTDKEVVFGFGPITDSVSTFYGFFTRPLEGGEVHIVDPVDPKYGDFFTYYTLGFNLMTSVPDKTNGADDGTNVADNVYFINVTQGFPQLSRYNTGTQLLKTLKGFPSATVPLVDFTGEPLAAYERLAQIRDMPVALISEGGFLYSLYREAGSNRKNTSWQLVKMDPREDAVDVVGMVRIPSNSPLLTVVPSPHFWYFVETSLVGPRMSQDVYSILEIPGHWVRTPATSPLKGPVSRQHHCLAR